MTEPGGPMEPQPTKLVVDGVPTVTVGGPRGAPANSTPNPVSPQKSSSCPAICCPSSYSDTAPELFIVACAQTSINPDDGTVTVTLGPPDN